MPQSLDYVSTPSTDDYGAGEPFKGARRYLVFLRKYCWIPALTLMLGIAGAAAYIYWAPPVYVSYSTMWETEKLHLSEGAIFTEDSQTYIGTQIELIKSGTLWQLAIQHLRALGTNTVPLDKDGLPLEVTLNFKEAPKSSVFSITSSSANPDYSRSFLNALMSEYLEYKRNARKVASGDTAASISAQVESLERELKSAQDALMIFQRTNNLAILEEEGKMAGSYLEKLQIQLSDLDLESQLLQASAVEQSVASQGNSAAGRDPVDLMKDLRSSSQTAASNPRLTPYQEVALLKAQREKLSRYLRPKHPKIVALDAQIADGEKIIELFRTQTHDQLEASEQAVKMKVESILASIKDWQGKVTEANVRIAEAERLKLNVTRAQNLYDRLAALLQNVDITRNTDLETMSVLQPASVAKRSFKLDIVVSVLAVIAGLGLGSGIVFVIEKRDDRFTSLVDLNPALGDAILGLLPEVTRKGKEAARLLEMNDRRHGYAESYRSLRSALLFSPIDGERPKVLLITSAMPGEGKSTVAANLAHTLAVSGSRVLLVDGDLRRGRLHYLLGMRNDVGLSELLSEARDPSTIMQKGSLPNFAFISSGARVDNPGNLFLGAGFDNVLARWRREFDFVIIDSSPVFAADDVSGLAPKAEGTLFVVRRGHSGAEAVSEAIDKLVRRQGRVLGVVFNGADASDRSYYYYKYADYYTSAKSAS